MHTYTIPSTLKAWLDNVILPGRTAAEGSALAYTDHRGHQPVPVLRALHG